MPGRGARLAEFRQSYNAQIASELDARTVGDKIEWVGVAVNVRSTQFSFASRVLRDLDLELRRAAAIALFTESPEFFIKLSGGEAGALARPELQQSMTADLGDLEIVEAAAGSLDLWLSAFGQVLTLLSSTPVTGLANALALSGVWTRIRVFLRRRDSPLDRVTAREALAILQAFGYDPANSNLGDPDRELYAGSPPHGHGRPRGYVALPDGTVANGRRVTVIRRHADGAFDYIFAD
jgi:hypothetical protein